MKYLKLFDTHSNYEAFVGDTLNPMIKPNVSHCILEDEVHYNPWTEPRLIVKYDGSYPTQLYSYESAEDITINGAAMFDKVEIDGVEVSIADLDNEGGAYQFATEGEHIVKYTLKDPTIIGMYGDPSDPSSVKIGAVFYGCDSVISVEIPDSVTSIGISAFNGCRSLTSVAIPNSVTSIGNYAFQNCLGLTSVTISDSVTSIGNGAFQYCSSLTSVTIPDSVTSIGDKAFAYSHLTNVIIGNGLTSLGDYAFECCGPFDSKTEEALLNMNSTALFCK